MSVTREHLNRFTKRYAHRKAHGGPRTRQGDQYLPTSVPSLYWKDQGKGFHSDMSEKARARLKKREAQA